MSVSPSLKLARRAGARRRRTTLLLSLLLVAALLPFTTHGAGGQEDDAAPLVAHRAASKSEARGAEFVPGQLLVRFRSDAAAQSFETVSRATGRALVATEDGEQVSARVERFEGSDLVRGLRIVYVAPEQTLAAVAAFKSRADVLYAEPDYVRHATANVPNDTLFSTMWNLSNTGQSGGTVGADIKATQAWDITTGSPNIVVGVIDEGIDISHPDLAANIWTNPDEVAGNGVDDDGNGKVDDVNGWDFSTCTGSPTDPSTSACGNNTVFDGPNPNPNPDTKLPTDAHGTHVAGTIGAVGKNGQGVVGVNWNVKIMPLKFLGVGTSNSASNAIRAEAYAKAMRDKFIATGGGANVRVLSNSYGGGGSSQAELDSIRAVGNSGILFVVAAGNESSNNDLVPTFPADYDAFNLISVASTTRNDTISFFSNIGARNVHIAAPGSEVLSTFPVGTSIGGAPANYGIISGTSMATPHVSAALALAANPHLTVQQLRSIILYNGDTISATSGNVYSQRRLNALGAVQAALENDTTAPAVVGNFQSAQNGRSVTFNFTAPGDDGNSGNASLYEISFVSTADGSTFILKTAIPKTPGSAESFTVNVPLRQTSGTLRVKAIDNVGNESLASISVSVSTNAADPYTTAESAFAGLAAQGTALGFHADDNYTTVSLPSGFSFPLFGQQNTQVVVSSNGNLYFQPLSTLPLVNPANGLNGDSRSSAQQLEGFKMVAGLWDDLRTDCTTGGSGLPCDVYVNTSDPNKVIFRWEARTFNTQLANGSFRGENPVSFEIELDRDGTILERYGAGNANVFPVVGIGAGEQGGSYLINSHTSPNALISLTNVQTVTFAPRATPGGQSTIQFNNAAQSTSESSGVAHVVVTRNGDLSAPASVVLRTVDDTRAIPCNDTTTAPGVAFARCDYATTVQTVTFATGDFVPKIIDIPIINDSYVEPLETVQVVLSNPTGATLTSQSTMTLTITSDDAAGAANPIDGTDFFVRMQYLDFLAREPEPGQPWSAVLNGCPPNDPTCDRISVSANFFRSQEFQLKGFFVFNFYKVAFARLPFYSEVIPDMSSITDTTPAGVQAKKAALTNSFVQRQEFVNAYGSLDNATFVNTLMNRYGIQSVTTPDPLNPDASTRVTLTRADLINRLNGVGGTLSRAQVVRAIADSNEVGAAEFNPAFVAMQYFGYLRRDPETQGYNDWLRTINANPADFRSMVNGFMNSTEYRLRFGNN
jgi:subtilisin family serine protease